MRRGVFRRGFAAVYGEGLWELFLEEVLGEAHVVHETVGCGSEFGVVTVHMRSGILGGSDETSRVIIWRSRRTACRGRFLACNWHSFQKLASNNIPFLFGRKPIGGGGTNRVCLPVS